MKLKNTSWFGFFFLSLFLLLYNNSWGQGGTWTWMRGSNSTNPVPVYGNQGVPDPGNDPQGFYEAANWIDQQGNFWIFGGLDSLFSETSDLWKYDPVNNVWTWMSGPGVPQTPGIYGMQGIPSPNNHPGARGWGCLSWTDNNGYLWLFGGLGFGSPGSNGYLNDLWKYDITTNEWTWVSGSQNANPADVYGSYQQPSAASMPGGRQENCSAWVDNGNNLWFFGGLGVTGRSYNDMWRYNIGTNQWAWMKGVQNGIDSSNYGTLGVEDPANLPPGRGTYTRWRDPDGNFYIWGGIKSFYPLQVFSDIWKYNPNTNNWTWVAGDSVVNSTGNYNQHCTDNGKTGPMARGENRTAQGLTCANVFLTFGGFVIDTDNLTPALNDLWLFNTQTNDWKWVSGTNIPSDPGNYGIKGVASSTNMPPGLYGACVWVDKTGDFWLFAGQDVNSLLYNGLWKFVPDTSCIIIPLATGIKYQLRPPAICPGDTSLLSITGSTNPVISPLTDVTWVDSVHAYLYPKITSNYRVSDNSPCSATNLANVNLDVLQPVRMNYFLPDSQICIGDSVLLTVINAADVVISPMAGLNWLDSSHAFLAPSATTTYTVTGQSTCTGTNTLISTLHVSSPSVQIASDTNRICVGDSVQICATGGFVSYLWNNGSAGVCIYSKQTGTYFVNIRDQYNCPATSSSVALDVLPVPPLLISLSNPVICRGDSALLNLSGTPAAVISPLTFVAWFDSVHAFLFPDSSRSYNVTNNLPCSTDSALSLNIIQPVYMSYTLNPSLICIGDSALLTVINGTDIQVSPLSGLIWKDSSDAFLSPNTSTTYTITGKSTCVSNNTFYTVLEVSNPKVSITADTTAICPGDTTQICATRGFASYRWNTGDTGLCIYTSKAGIYFVHIKDLNNCPAASNSIPVTVYAVPDISILVVGDSFTVYNGHVIQWYLNGIAIEGATSQTYVADQPGDYTVAVIDPDGCHTTSGSVLLAASGIANLEEDNIVLYPNPSSGAWNLQVGNDWMGSELDIFDAEGRLVYKSEIRNQKSEIQLNVEAGIYFLRLYSSGNSFIHKLIKL